KNAREKVATLLLDMRRRLRADPAGVIELPLSRQQIADVLGLTIETVSRQIGELKRMGVIALAGRRGVRVVDEERLEGMA
ncbi:nitrogen fixation transcriptional regulator protein, partial [Sphingomonas sp. BHC-A]